MGHVGCKKEVAAVKAKTLWSRLVVSLSLVALGGCSLARQESRMGTTPLEATERSVQVTADVVYGHKFGMALTFDAYQPPKKNGAAVLFMNSAGFHSGRVRQCEAVERSRYRFIEPEELAAPVVQQLSFEELLAHGFTVFDVMHGSRPKFRVDEIVGDMRRAVRFIKLHAAEFDVDPDRIGVWGCSAGGYLAVLLGVSSDEGQANAESALERMNNRVQAVVAYYPGGFDIVAWKRVAWMKKWLDVDEEVLKTLSIRSHISPDDPPILIVYGTADSPAVTAACEDMRRAFDEHGLESKHIVLPGTGHMFSGEDGFHAHHADHAMKELVAWFERHLAKSG